MLKLNLFKSLSRTARGFSRFAVVAFAGMALVSLSFGQATFVGIHGKLKVQGSHIVDQNGNLIQLHGMSMYGWTNACGYAFYNSNAIKYLAQTYKCTVLRIPYQTGGSISMAIYDTAIQACINNGIYAILDWHSDGGDQTLLTQAEAFFTTVATKYGNIPNIMYEPWNEPSGSSDTWAVIKAYMESVIAVIRKIDTANIILCGNPQWNQLPNEICASPGPITDFKNIAYTMHFYAYSHHVSTYGPNIKTAMNCGCPIFITEYGTCNASGGGPTDTADTRLWYKFLDSNSIGSANWGCECVDENGGAACFTAGTSATGPWTSANLTESGAFVFAYILKGYQGLTPVVPNGSQFQQRADAPKINGLLTGAETKSAAVFTINGVRCPAGATLPNGLYIIRTRENITVTGLMMR